MKTCNKTAIYEAQKDADDIMLSVVLLTYNHEKYIRTCLESIISQKTTFKFELIVGDDASTDQTAKVILEYAALYPDIVVPVIRKKNIGAVANLVELLKIARGKYIAGCEGDDYWTNSNKLEFQFRFLEEKEDYIACSHDIEIVNEDGTLADKQYLTWISPARDYSLKDYKGILLPGHPVALVFRNIFKEEEDPGVLLDFHTSIADRTLAVMLAVRGRIYRLDKIMAAYRIHVGKGTNMTNNIYGEFDSCLIDYTMNDRITKYLSKMSGKNIDFVLYRWKIVIKVGIKTVIYFNKNNLSTYIKLLKLHFRWIKSKIIRV